MRRAVAPVAVMGALICGLLAVSAALAQPATAPTAAAPSAAETPEQRRGRMLFLQCRACHELQPSAAELVGPNLGGLFGRKVASVPDFEYSAALRAQSFVWDRERLDKWMERPGALVPGNIMAFGGVASAADRAALIAYLEAATAPR